MQLVRDKSVPFLAYFVRAKTKTEQRTFVAQHALLWLRCQKSRGAKGAVMVDIDDTLIDSREAVVNGFQFMHELFTEASLYFPFHVVTARPDDQHANVMKMLRERGFSIPPDRLHMLPEELYGRSTRYVEEFKWRTYLKIGEEHQGVVARFGDKLWDVGHIASYDTYLKHVRDKDCYVFMDPTMCGTFSAKLPGLE